MPRKHAKAFVDLHSLPEDGRISVIASRVRLGETVGVVVDSKEVADRYLTKIRKLAPNAVVEWEGRMGPGMYSFKVRRFDGD